MNSELNLGLTPRGTLTPSIGNYHFLVIIFFVIWIIGSCEQPQTRHLISSLAFEESYLKVSESMQFMH